jgi:UDP-N-acetylmuramyl pentapeptide phosphotransferase/UDP-N-acetylglucosamine-1-phosphate transferase
MDSSAFVAFGSALVLAPLTTKALRRFDILDRPSDRSSHAEPVPRGVGLALAVAALVGLAISNRISGASAIALGIATVGFGLIGLIEDIRGIPPAPRLALHAVAAAAALQWLTVDVTGSSLWRVVFAAGVLVWLVSFVNSFNFMDGINGVSVAQALVAGIAYLIVGWTVNLNVLSAGGAIIVAVALAFAPLNFPTARCFLGDVGSYFIGAWLAVLVVIGLRAGVAPEAMLAPTGVYLLDTASTLVRRVRMGESWWQPHRSHVYQRLTDLGWSHTTTTAFVAGMILACSVLGTLSLVGSTPTRVAADAGIGLALAFYVTMPRRVTLRRETRTAVARELPSPATSR